jgi:hypothetical protein
MVTLNLLPPREKEKIASRRALRKAVIFGFSSLFLVVIFLAFLSSVWWYLLIQLRSAEDILKQFEANPQNTAFREFKKEVDEINRELKYIDQLQAETKNYPLYLEKLADLKKEGIKFKRLAVGEDKIILDGYAPTREVLLSFKDVLAASPYFEKLETPLSNFLKQTEIDFSFSFQIKR